MIIRLIVRACAVLLGGFLLWVFFGKKNEDAPSGQKLPLERYTEKIQKQKDAEKKKILKMMELSDWVAARDVAYKLLISNEVAERRLSDLVRDGYSARLVQDGVSVYYLKRGARNS